MNEITVLIYFICFAVVFGATFAFMWRMMTITLRDFDRVKNIHPELKDVKPGEELLVFQVKDEKDQNNKMSRPRVIKDNNGVAIVEGTPASSLIKEADKFFAIKPPERMAGESVSQPRKIDTRAINTKSPIQRRPQSERTDEERRANLEAFDRLSEERKRERTINTRRPLPKRNEARDKAESRRRRFFERRRSAKEAKRSEREQKATQGKFITTLGR